MRSKLLHEENGKKTFALVFEVGDEVVSELRNFARKNKLDDASISAIGAFSGATLGFFDPSGRDYKEIPVEEQVEVLSLLGNIASRDNGELQVHVHVVVGRSDGSTRGGHLLEARVRPTLEVVLVETPEHLRRRWDEQIGLALIDL
jgi:predicted DNA-binding protein with PD1-like motif